MSRSLHVALICDPPQERWRSMDVVAQRLFEEFSGVGSEITATRIYPRWRNLTGGFGNAGFNAERLLNRFVTYPLHVRKLKRKFDVFHVIDHSYAHLVQHLPAEKTVVTCHDIDAFRALWNRSAAPKDVVLRAMASHTLTGLRQCSTIVCDSEATRDDLATHDLAVSSKITVVPLGANPTYFGRSDPEAHEKLNEMLGPAHSHVPELLHVGLNVPRKRVDDLLEILALVRSKVPMVRLIRVGEPLTRNQQLRAERLGIADAIVCLADLSEPELAELYRRAFLLLLPSSREGFGFPVVEAMACGTPAVVSDLPVLREVGGFGGTYVPVGDVKSWCEAIVRIWAERTCSPRAWIAWKEQCRQQAGKFTWARTASKLATIYEQVHRA